MIAFICEQGAKIRQEGERLIVCGKSAQQTLYTRNLEQLVLFGNIHLTAQARSLILSKKIPTVFLTSQGAYRGRLEIDEGENVFLSKRQYELLSDMDFQLKAAKEIVLAKLHNQRWMLTRIRKEHQVIEASRVKKELLILAEKAKNSESIQSLRGMEGAAAEAYFPCLAKAFKPDLGFVHRKRRPPTDPVNAVLSLVYTLLINRCHTACRLAGLDPYPGNLHSLEYGRHSLPLDLVEEFRALFGDALTLALFNRHILTKDDFEKESSENADEPCRVILTEKGMKKLLGAFQAKLESSFPHPHLNKKISYAEAINHQAHAYRDLVEGRAEKYQPLLCPGVNS